MYPKRTLEFCCEQSKEISVEFVQYLCANSESPLQYFLYYTKQVLMAVPLHNRFVERTWLIMNAIDLLMAWFSDLRSFEMSS